MAKCCVCQCSSYRSSYTKDKLSERNRVSFFRFPRDPELRNAWFKAICRDSNGWKPNWSICSQHFLEEHIDRLAHVGRLRPFAKPTQLLHGPWEKSKDIIETEDSYKSLDKIEEPPKIDEAFVIKTENLIEMENIGITEDPLQMDDPLQTEEPLRTEDPLQMENSMKNQHYVKTENETFEIKILSEAEDHLKAEDAYRNADVAVIQENNNSVELLQPTKMVTTIPTIAPSHQSSQLNVMTHNFGNSWILIPSAATAGSSILLPSLMGPVPSATNNVINMCQFMRNVMTQETLPGLTQIKHLHQIS